MNLVRCEIAQAAVMMLVIVPGEKLGAEPVRILVTAKALGKLRAVLHRFELALRVWIVIGDMRATVGLGDSESGQKNCHRLGRHRCSPIRMHGKTPWPDIIAPDSLLDEFLGQLGRFAVGQHPTDDVAAENIEDHVEIKIRPLGRSQQLGDVPGPDFIGLAISSGA